MFNRRNLGGSVGKLTRRISILFVFMLLFQTLLSSFAYPAQINAAGSENKVIKGITVTDGNGHAIDEDALEESTDVRVRIDWSIGDVDVVEGSTDSITLPPALSVSENQSGTLGETDAEVGTYELAENGTVTVSFNESVMENPEANGTFEVAAVLEVEVAEEEMKEETTVNPEEDIVVEEEGNSTEPEEKLDEKTVANPEKEETVKTEDKLTISSASEEEIEGLQETADRFTLEVDTFLDMSQEELSEANDNLPGLDNEFIMRLNWELLDGHGYVTNDTTSFNLPSGIDIQSEQTGELKTADDQTVVTFTISTDGTVEFIFTDYVENYSQVRGYMYVYSYVDIDEAKEEDGEIIILPIGDEGEKRLPIDMGERQKTIEKEGQPNRSYNADEINWEVTINKDRLDLTNAKVVDTLPAGTEYLDGSITVTELIVNLKGEVIEEGEEFPVVGVTSGEGILTIPLGDIDRAYKIEYTTTVIDDDATVFQNNAVLQDDDLDDVSANSTIVIDRGDALNKTSGEYDPASGEIEWTVDFNFNQKSLEGVTFTDIWKPEGALELVEDSLTFTEVEIDENGNAQETGNVGLPGEASFSGITDGFEVTNITTGSAYRITYTTQVRDRVMDGYDVENTAEFGEESATSGTYVGQFVGDKGVTNVNYADRTIDWRITLNQDNYHMEDISIVDTMTEGLTPQEDSYSVTVGGGPYADYTVSGDNPITIDFGDLETTDEIVITYTTDFEADNMPSETANNTAAINWMDEYGDRQDKSVEAEVRLNDASQNNHWKNGSYDPASKEITWNIITNYRQNSIEDLNITDAPQGNQEIVPESVRVHELTIDANGNHRPGVDVTGDVEVSYNEDNNTFSVGIGAKAQAYFIEYRTSLEDLNDIQGEYINEAEVRNGSETLAELDAKAGVAGYNTYAAKDGIQNGKRMDWTVQVNVGQQVINELALTDTLSENQEVLPDSIEVYNAAVVSGGSAQKAGEPIDPNLYELTVSEDLRTIDINWNNQIERAFVVEYSSLFFAAHEEEVSNSYEVTGEGDFIEDANNDGNETRTIEMRSGGGAEGTAGYLVIDKIDVTNGGNDKLAGAEFDLIDPDTGIVLKSGTTDENGQIDFGRLLFGEYELVERVIPEGYVSDAESQTITIDTPYSSDADLSDYAYTVENFVPVHAINLLKTDDLNQPVSGVKFTLYDSENNEIETVETNEDGEILFENLQSAGTYYIEEISAPAGYEPSEERHEVIVGEQENLPATITIVNQRELTEIEGQKVWDDEDNQDGNRPESITVNLLADEEEIDSVQVTSGNGWQYSFNNLPTHSGGEEITYTVEENPVDGYETEIDGFDITNSYTPEVIDASGVKTWDDSDDRDRVRPESITVNLLVNGVQTDSEEVTAEDNWEYSFEGLSKFEAGEEIIYTITEDTVEHYSQNINGYNITNSYTPELTVATVTKAWNDANNQDGNRPESIDVQLTGDGELVGDVVELSEDNNWTYSWGELPLNNDGTAINYSVEELTELDRYEITVDDENHGNIIITNAYTPEVLDINGAKTWDDADNRDGIRPSSITVTLFANGELIKSKGVTGVNDWSYSFTDLPKYEAGEEIKYTITEDPVEGYETTINGFDITNSYTPEVTEVSGVKTWEDVSNQDGVRPESITVNLLANGEKVDSTEVTEEGDWGYSFTYLPKNKAGVEIVYTITEDSVNEYSTEINGHDITNRYTPGQTSVTATKHWDDVNNQDGKRLDVIEIQLSADGEDYGQPVELSEANNWTHTWTELDEKVAGETIVYSVIELTEVPGYEAVVNDENHGNIIITNTYTPEVFDINGAKTWDDRDNQDGIRPTSININLFANGELVKSIVVTEGKDWSYRFTNVPRNEAGEEIVYTITEDIVEGYETTINGFDITNTLIKEKFDSVVDESDEQDDGLVSAGTVEQGDTGSSSPNNDGTTELPDRTDSRDSNIDGNKLPNTATNMFNTLVIGAGLLILGIALIIYRRKRTAN